MKLRPDHSTTVDTSTFVAMLDAHVMHVRVLTENTLPLGTSGVRVVVIMTTYSSKSQCTVSSRISHFVCFGPMPPDSGLMYDMFRASSFGSSMGIQSDI